MSPKRQGTGRYPGFDLVEDLAGRKLNLAAHLCGGYAQEVVDTGRCIALEQLPRGLFRRVQVNTSDPVSPAKVAEMAGRVGARRAILQCRGDFPEDDAVDWLYDRSGGVGRLPERWPSPPRRGTYGYAGGLSPSTAAAALHAISAAGAPDGGFWIDMETGVRTEERFDLALCEQVLSIVHAP